MINNEILINNLNNNEEDDANLDREYLICQESIEESVSKI